VRFIVEHADRVTVDGLRWGVEPICAVLTEHGTPIAPSTYYEHTAARATAARAERDARADWLDAEVARVHAANYDAYGARKVWLQLRREQIDVARCTVEASMRRLGLQGARRGTVKKTTIADPQAGRPGDLVARQFNPERPDRLWVADFTYVSTWSGWVYVAFVIDAYARRILGWRCSSSMTTPLVLDAIEQAIWTREREGVTDLTGLVHHNDRGSQYTSIAFTERLLDAGIDASVGATGSSYDNALAETINGLYKTELIRPRGPWRTLEQVEIATLEWVDWFNHRRIAQHCDDLTPVEFEQAYYRRNDTRQHAEYSQL
jgi:putative transposase